MAFTHPTAQKLLTTTTTTPLPPTPPPAYLHDPTFQTTISNLSYPSSDCGSDSDSETSIHLRISTPLTIKGDNNLIAVDASLSASKITVAVMGALKTMSMNGFGIPMIDENGRPRPISVEVQAETRVEGSRNVVGEKAVLVATLGSGAGRRKAEAGSGADREKRQRAASEPVEGGRKRARTE